jgi:hypothetical protein
MAAPALRAKKIYDGDRVANDLAERGLNTSRCSSATRWSAL